MDSSRVKKLNLFNLPLTGRALIEASAGTGKTYSLAFIYLRLLLGLDYLDSHNESEKNESKNRGDRKPLTVEEILVVTFTKAATQELRTRIRQNIYQLKSGLIEGKHRDPTYQQLIDLVSDRKKAIQLLTEAGQSMDEAAIYTIHGFCQRTLTTHAFESGVLFEQTLVANEQQLRLQVAQDFWRLYFTPLDKPLAYLILEYWQDPVELLADITPYLNIDTYQHNQSDIVTTIKQFYIETFEKIHAIKTAWLDISSQIIDIINQSGVSKQSYSSRNLPLWINKITDWANTETTHFTLPSELVRFSQATLLAKTKEGKEVPKHPIFIQIEQLLSLPNLRSKIIIDIARTIRQAIYSEKIRRGEMGFDDLLNQLNRALYALKEGNNGGQFGSRQLAQNIAKKYPFAMIDEFQDTDPIQYQIFDRIYNEHHDHFSDPTIKPTQTGLLFIGDPKQAIYSFRGADIFTYIQAKQSTKNHYTMETNWRSSLAMVNAVNQLFSAIDNPFIFKEIPFIAMQAADQNPNKGLEIAGEKINALNAYLLSDDSVTVADYQNVMANYCAEQIVKWLSGGAMLVDPKEGIEVKRAVSAADIAILVRKSDEADLIRKQLALRGVKAVYLSERNSVFSSVEAKELLYLLQAALMPEDETVLRVALMSRLVGLSMVDIELMDQESWETVIEEFKQYQATWLRYGILVMLRRMMQKRGLAENILAHDEGERILTNFMHLGELLQEAAYQLDSPNALVRWLTKQIKQPDPNQDNHELRLESDENLVKIITIHKAKGLEYPLVWLPFIANYRTTDTTFYHDPKDNYRKKYAWQLTDEIKQQIENERLAEDLRLLYVAMTRSIYHCSIGIAKLKQAKSAINHLLNGDLNQIAGELILVDPKHQSQSYYHSPKTNESILSAAIFKRHLINNWGVTSYSGLQKGSQKQHLAVEINDHKWDEDQTIEPVEPNSDNTVLSLQYDIHHFPKGREVGLQLHKVLEQIMPNSPDSIQECSLDVIKQLNLSSEWLTAFSEWLYAALSTQLIPSSSDEASLTPKSSIAKLSDVLQGRCLHELQFYLPICQPVTCNKLDKLAKKYDPLSRLCPQLDFDTVEGMLKGFIDLLFEWQGKYYIIDYKSNWLGNSADDYNMDAINQAMCEHRYELQYQLYSLAVHRFLRSRLTNYQYQQHFGGVYYLFLRGLPHNGTFYYLPDEQFITELDLLFSGDGK
ncbi:exodeoxyribonuclease V subunit beta [Orbaceae bacterium ESL0721]|nr:exodeoxyribonuclease V subunit beta [Orbaceae bacterium ESL0721]